MAKFVHSMIRVINEDRSTDFYSRAFGLTVADRFAFADFTLVYLRNSEADFELELTINHGVKESYGLGTGYGHAAFVVDDLDVEHERLQSEGLDPGQVKELNREGKLLARFFFIQDPDGYRIEVIQRHDRFR